jgi:hypothetical protein
MLVTIATFSFPHEAYLAKARLDVIGIKSFITDEHAINIFSNAMSGVRLQVPAAFAAQAQQALNEPVEIAPIPELEIDSEPKPGAPPYYGQASTAMSTMSGTGTRLYGKRDKDSDGWYTATKFFCFLYLPIVPLSCHRVRKTSSSVLRGVSVNQYEMYPIDANIPQVRNVYLVAYGLPLVAYALFNLIGS